MVRLIFSAKIVATAAAVLSAAMALWLDTPAVSDFLFAGAPRIYGSVASWLTPFYIYLIINGIIISIAATSRRLKTVEDADLRAEVQHRRTGGDEIVSLSAEPENKEFVISSSRLVREIVDPPEKFTGNGLVRNKPLVSARISRRRRRIKGRPEGKALGVARPRMNETLESTWRTLTGGRAVPLARHLKKSDTWATHGRGTAGNPTPPPATHDIQKHEFFTARSSAFCGGFSFPAAKLRRESSLGHDDLNRRVEAFIKKFNEEMRLQRQESLQKYKDMINRGSR